MFVCGLKGRIAVCLLVLAMCCILPQASLGLSLAQALRLGLLDQEVYKRQTDITDPCQGLVPPGGNCGQRPLSCCGASRCEAFNFFTRQMEPCSLAGNQPYCVCVPPEEEPPFRFV